MLPHIPSVSFIQKKIFHIISYYIISEKHYKLLNYHKTYVLIIIKIIFDYK